MSIDDSFYHLIQRFVPENKGTAITTTTNGADAVLAANAGHDGDDNPTSTPYSPKWILDGALLGDEDAKLSFFEDDGASSYTAEHTASQGPARKRVRGQARKEQNKASARKTRERRKAAATALEQRLAANKLALEEVERMNVELLKGIQYAKGRVEAYTAALQPQ